MEKSNRNDCDEKWALSRTDLKNMPQSSIVFFHSLFVLEHPNTDATSTLHYSNLYTKRWDWIQITPNSNQRIPNLCVMCVWVGQYKMWTKRSFTYVVVGFFFRERCFTVRTYTVTCLIICYGYICQLLWITNLLIDVILTHTFDVYEDWPMKKWFFKVMANLSSERENCSINWAHRKSSYRNPRDIFMWWI